MFKVILAGVAAYMLVLSAPVMAQAAPAPQQATAPAAQPENEGDQQIRCRRIEVTGSLIRRERVCKTVAEWRRLQEGNNDNARDIVDQSRGRPPGGP